MPSADPKLRLLVRHSDSPKDVGLANELLGHLKPLQRFAGLDVWTDHRIKAGDETRREIERAIDQADVVLLLLSADFFASDTLLDVEVPKLMERHRQGSLKVVPVLLRSCMWDAHPWLSELRPQPRDGKPIASHQGDERDRVLTELVKEVAGLVTPSTSTSTTTNASQQVAVTSSVRAKEAGATYITNIHSSTIGGLGVGLGASVTGETKDNKASSPPATYSLNTHPLAASPRLSPPALQAEQVCLTVEACYSFDHSGVILTCEVENRAGRRLKIREISLKVDMGVVLEPDEPPDWRNLGSTWCGPGLTEAIEPDDLTRLSWFMPAPELREHFRRTPSLAAELHVRYFPALEIAREVVIETLDFRRRRSTQTEPSETSGTSAAPVPTRPVGQEQPHAGNASIGYRDEARENWITSERPSVKFIAPPGWSKRINGDWGVFISTSGSAVFAFTTFARLEEAMARLNQVASVLGVAEVEWRSPQPGNIGRRGFHALKGEGTCSFRGPGGYIWYALANAGTSDQMLLVYTVSVTGTQADKDAVLTSIKSLQRR